MDTGTPEPDADPLEPYRHAVREHGGGFAATLWASRRWQQRRFDVLIDLLSVERLRDAVILDLGCGDGALAARLGERSIRFRRYIGVDGLLEQVEAAQRREIPGASFVCADLLEAPKGLGRFHADIAFLSGTLNTMSQDVAMNLVSHVFEGVTDAVAFNFLSDRPSPDRLDAPLGPARRHDVLRWIDHALGLSPLVAFRQDHMDGHDGAVLIRRQVPKRT